MELRTDAVGYIKGITDAERRAKALDSTFKGISSGLKITTGLFAAAGVAATATAGALFAITKNVANLGDRLNDASKITGIAVEQLSFMKAVAEQSGATFDDVQTSLKFLNKNFSDLASGADKGVGPLQALGITAEQFKESGNDVNKLLPEVIKRFGNMADGADKVKLAIELFGRSGTNLIPTLNDIAKNGEALREKFESLGVILSTEVAEASDKFNDSLDDVNKAIEGVKILIGSELLPVFSDLFKDLATWISKNRELIKDDVKGFVEGIKVAIDNLKTAFGGLPSAISGTDSQFGILTNTMIGVNEVILAAIKGISTLKTIQLGLKKAEELPGDILGLPSSEEFKQQEESLYQLNRTIDALQKNLDNFKQTGHAATDATQELYKASEFLDGIMNDAKETTSAYIPELKNLTGGTEKLTEAEKALKKAKEEQARVDEQALEQIQSLTKQWNEQAETLGMTAAQTREYTLRAIEANLASQGLSEEGLAAVKKALEEAAAAMSKLNFKEGVRNVMEFADAWGDAVVDELTEGSEKGKEAVDSLGEFIGDVASNISSTIADMLTAAFTGNFDDIKRSWKDMLKNMLNIFFQFVAAIITNPIRIALDASLKGGGGGAGNVLGGIRDAIGGIFGGLGKSFGALGSLFGIGGGMALSPALAIGEAFTPFGLGTMTAGFGATLSAALPAIGAIISAAMIAIPLIIDAFKKTPRLDIDFDSVKTETGKRAAIIGELLDEEFFKDVIAKISVKRKAGLGIGGDDAIKDAIYEVIKASIESIQSIIAKLPENLFKQLNEMLLNAEVDTSTVIGGERLLEFDAKGKKIAEKWKAFIEGELPAKVFASIKDSFFEPAFEALGVASDAAKKITDDYLEKLKGASSREERAQIGQDFLELFNAYVEVFNVINGHAQDAFGKALSDIKALTESLDIESATGIPTLNEIQVALEELFETGQLTAETAQQFLALRAAIIQLTVALAQSVSSIASTIEQLNTDIVALGGSAYDTSDDLRQAISDIDNMLNEQGLSLDEREQLLNAKLSLTNQLAANELAKQQAEQQAQTAKRQAAINKQIQSLQTLKSKEEELNKSKIDALNKQLDIARGLESLLKSVQALKQSLLFAPGGPESVYARIARARGEIDNLFRQMMTASPEDRVELGAKLQDMLDELNRLRQEGFQSPSPESDALFREVILGLEKLEGLVEPTRSSEEIEASIEAISKASQEYLSSIDSQIQSMQSELSSIGNTTNTLTGQAADEIRALKESIRDDFVEILKERIAQLDETTNASLGDIVSVASDQLTVLKQIRNNLKAIANGEDAIPGMSHGGFVPPGKVMLARLHGGQYGEDVIPRIAGASERISGTSDNYSFNLTLPPITFDKGQVVSPEMFTNKVISLLHDRRVVDEMAKAVAPAVVLRAKR